MGDLRSRSRKGSVSVEGAHISVIGHVTSEELIRRLNSTEVANGFANRFLFASVSRSKLLPFATRPDIRTQQGIEQRLRVAAGKACSMGGMTFTPDGSQSYAGLYRDVDARVYHGPLGALTARATTHVLRLAVVYAVLDSCSQIGVEHVQAASAVWEYCEASVRHLFGTQTGDPLADRLLHAIVDAGGKGLSLTEQSAVFGRNQSRQSLDEIRELLTELALIETRPSPGRGRRSYTTTKYENNESNEGRAHVAATAPHGKRVVRSAGLDSREPDAAPCPVKLLAEAFDAVEIF